MTLSPIELSQTAKNLSLSSGNVNITKKPAKFTLQKILPSLSFLFHMSVPQTFNTLSSLLHPLNILDKNLVFFGPKTILALHDPVLALDPYLTPSWSIALQYQGSELLRNCWQASEGIMAICVS